MSQVWWEGGKIGKNRRGGVGVEWDYVFYHINVMNVINVASGTLWSVLHQKSIPVKSSVAVL